MNDTNQGLIGVDGVWKIAAVRARRKSRRMKWNANSVHFKVSSIRKPRRLFSNILPLIFTSKVRLLKRIIRPRRRKLLLRFPILNNLLIQIPLTNLILIRQFIIKSSPPLILRLDHLLRPLLRRASLSLFRQALNQLLISEGLAEREEESEERIKGGLARGSELLEDAGVVFQTDVVVDYEFQPWMCGRDVHLFGGQFRGGEQRQFGIIELGSIAGLDQGVRVACQDRETAFYYGSG